jgi:predicted TPR repeat methyltransferase
VKKSAPVYKHIVELGDGAGLFASGVRAPQTEKTAIDVKDTAVELAPSSKAIDAGERLPGFNDDLAGAAPDLGAYELGLKPPRYGPREPEPAK